MSLNLSTSQPVPLGSSLLASFEYDHPIALHGKTTRLSQVLIGIVLGGVMLTTYVLLVVNKGVETASVALIVLALVSFFIYKLIFRGVSKSRKKFFVYRHYLLLGDQVLHYQNVDRAILSPSRGIIQLHDRVHNRNIMIDRTKFICVTKKSEKIKIRQAEKFQKTLQALVPALQADNPQLRIERA